MACVTYPSRLMLVFSVLSMLFSVELKVDLSMCLSRQAKEMVELSKSIANKIKEKQGDITEDEVNEFCF